MGELFWNIDWHGIFTPQNSLLELIVRGTIMYLVLLALLRFVLNGTPGRLERQMFSSSCSWPKSLAWVCGRVHFGRGR